MGWGGYGGWGGFRPYVPVARKLATAQRHAAQVAKKEGRELSPVNLDGRTIAKTFWGKAWCDNLAAYSDYANRLPRGATYVRNGSVVDLFVQRSIIEAIVAGSEPYKVNIRIDALDKAIWKKIKKDCSASIDSLLDLLAGRFSDGVMRRLTQQQGGLFPSPREIKMKCSCPDWSYCCKHLAAVMYGVGARLDRRPELLFVLRGVDHQELVSQAVAEGNLDKELAGAQDSTLAGEDLGAIFGIELDATAPPSSAPESPRRSAAARSTKSGARAGRPKRSAKPAGKPKRAGAQGATAKPTARTTAETKEPVAKKSTVTRKPKAKPRKRVAAKSKSK